MQQRLRAIVCPLVRKNYSAYEKTGYGNNGQRCFLLVHVVKSLKKYMFDDHFDNEPDEIAVTQFRTLIVQVSNTGA
jgi:hypothetical protein